MREIRIHYVDFWKNFDPKTFEFTKILEKKYIVVFDEKNPEYIFCSNFGTDYLKYDGIRILFLGEAVAPDFNVYDYAIAFDDIQFGDRYLRYPLCFFKKDMMNLAIKKHTYSDDYYLSKKKFCNQLVSNSSGDEIRDRFFEGLSKYKKVDSGGKYKNNMPDGLPVANKLSFQQEYRYSLVFENSSFPGYVTEKIMDAFAAATIPIYWGDSLIDKELNNKAFINCNSMRNVLELIDVIKKIETDEELYLSIMKEPIFNNDSSFSKMIEDNYLSNFIYSIFEREYKLAYRRNSKYTMWGKVHEDKLKKWRNLENSILFKKLKRVYKVFKK